ncbi:hypothetical protein FRC12_015678 [Ceratobasidium sp. 428]|nr:hypothetical protein FRC12_015678 [Ceratobasidium sp. 428]
MSLAANTRMGRMSAAHTPTTRMSPAPGGKKPLPPDAVDLVVEDPDAAEARAAWDRRKGDPALRPGGKKAYRRGYVLDDGRDVERNTNCGGLVDQTEIRVQDVSSSSSSEQLQREEAETEDKHGRGREMMIEAETTEVTVARAMTPPLRAIVTTNTFGASESSLSGSPWA